jgi:hypothetical protein
LANSRFGEIMMFEGSPFVVLPDILVSRSLETLSEAAFDDYMIVEGGPLDGLQCGEKMWIILDAQTAPFKDIEFQVAGKPTSHQHIHTT